MLGIVILNYKNWDETIKCINSIFNNEPTLDEHNIYIVDNASPNPPSKRFKDIIQQNSNIYFIKSEKNRGFAAGNNIGIAKAKEDMCDYVIVSNSDIYFQKHSLDEIIKFYSLHSGICYPKISNLEGNVPFIPKSFDTSILQLYFRHTVLKSIFKSRYKALCEDSIDMESDSVVENYLNAGSCFAMDRNALDKLTPLDENTFLYYEEMILSSRANDNNIHIYFNPQSKVIHAEGQSTGKENLFARTCMYQSAIYYARVYLNARVIQVIPIYIYFELVFLLKAIKYKEYRGHFKSFKKKLKLFLY